MNRITEEDVSEVEHFWSLHKKWSNTEVIELIDSQTGTRSILIKEVKVNVSEAKLCDI